MKLSRFSFVVAAAAISIASYAHAAVIATWTFETSAPVTAGPFAAEIGAGSALGSHSNGATVYSSPAGNGSAHSFSSNTWNVGDYYQFQVSTTGLNGITVQWDQAGSGTGPKDFGLFYSTDGTSFTQFGSNYAVLLSGFSTVSFNPAVHYSRDLSSITALDNQATVYFRLVDQSTTSINNGTVASGGTDRVDNFSVETVPEPMTLALLAMGGLFAARRRRTA